MLYGLEATVANRWMDKYNVIVCGDGQAGMNWEHSMLDGHTMMEFFAPIAAGYDAGVPTVDAEEEVLVEPLELEVDQRTATEIAQAMETSRKLSRNVGVATLEYTPRAQMLHLSMAHSPQPSIHATHRSCHPAMQPCSRAAIFGSWKACPCR